MKAMIPILAASFLTVAFGGISSAADTQEQQQEMLKKQQEGKEAIKEVEQNNQKEMAERAKVVNESMQQISRATKVLGTSVKNPSGESLGDINELVFDPKTGQMVYAVVAYGGVLGMGDRLFAVPWQALRWTVDKEYYVLDMDKDVLKKAPGFDKNKWPDSSSKWDQQRADLVQFYHIKP